ncbi:MAG: DNA alkylation repair protein [Clostridiales bacterium]|nr:DNA alkylation repair protein [Clostridiales bacterium]
MAIKREIEQQLKSLADEKYRNMQVTIIPTVAPETIIGVRTPELRKIAKELAKRSDVSDFLSDLPHKYFEENQLHAFVLSEMKDFDSCIRYVDAFLPYVDNWATCDQMSPKIFKKHKKELLSWIDTWISSKETYTVRFAIGMLMEHFLDEDFDPAYPKMVSKVRSEEYYVNMMIAWYFATALAKQYDSILPYIEKKKLSDWTHNKAIQKSVESYRITDEQKAYLKTLKVKPGKK